MTRRKELDAMTEDDKKVDLLKNLQEHGEIRIDNVHAMNFWQHAIAALEREGKIETEFRELYDEQYSYLKVRLKT